MLTRIVLYQPPQRNRKCNRKRNRIYQDTRPGDDWKSLIIKVVLTLYHWPSAKESLPRSSGIGYSSLEKK
jgi:hypothetical protein